MDIKIKYQKSLKLYVARISDGSRYGRQIYGKTPEIVKEKLQGFWSMPTKQNRDGMTIGEVLSGFILHMEKRTLGKVDGQKRIRLQSYENYKSYDKALVALTVLSKPLGDYKIQQIDKSFLNEILNALEQKYNTHSAKHKHELFSYFKSAMLWLHKQDRELYPLVDLREIVVKLDKKEAFVPKRLDAQLVLRTIDQVCMEKYAIFAHLCANGLRASEANGLKPSDFDPTNKTVHVQRIVDRSRNVIAIETGYEIPTKTKSSNRKVPLGSELASRIRKFIMANPNLEWLFQSDQRYDGRPIKQQNLTKSGLHKALKHLKSKGQNVEWKGAMHGLRHYYGSLLLAEAAKLGRNPTWVQKRLGHSNLQTTLGIYSHDIDEDTQDLNNEVERRLNG
jgi:integrase